MDHRMAASGTWACSCPCCGNLSLRSPKRKMVVAEPSAMNKEFARVEIEEEAAVLREALVAQQKSVQLLGAELEEERSAAASAATEAMSMIIRLQREKSEALMEVRQFKRLTEEKMAHYRREISALEDLIFEQEQTINSLSCQLQAHRHGLLSYGMSIPVVPLTDPMTPDTVTYHDTNADFSCYVYPPLLCNTPDEDVPVDLEKCDDPSEQLLKFEESFCGVERKPRRDHLGKVTEKRVVAGHSPPQGMHVRKLSLDSCASSLEFVKEFPIARGHAFDGEGRYDMTDKICTVDTMRVATEEHENSPRGVQNMDMYGSDAQVEIRRLCKRLDSLEVDRESIRKSLISMGADKAQAVLLQEIVQQFCEDVVPEKKSVKNQSFIRRFSIMLAFKSVMSFVFKRKKPTRIRHSFGLSANNAGLLLLLHKSSHARSQWHLARIQGKFPTFSAPHEHLEIDLSM
ncbi:myosin-binding protein 7-like [Curcuma longa]|uniref:myosin-binding protein 7-like n=1 Tax=Curcuma longa TaxID=136217 RepID=UPI003D9F0EB3